MTEKTKDIIGYSAAAIMLIIAGVLLYDILQSFYYGFGGGFGWTTILFGL